MYDQPKYKPLRRSDFFADQRDARPLVDGTVARGMLRADTRLSTGKDGALLTTQFPMKPDRALLERGRDRYNIYCSPCHDRTGAGAGMVVRRGYRAPSSFHIDRLRDAPVGHFFDVITNGFGAMPDYAAQIPIADRWAIVAYVRALQLSQNVRSNEIAPEDRARLEALPKTAPESAAPLPTPGAPFFKPAATPISEVPR